TYSATYNLVVIGNINVVNYTAGDDETINPQYADNDNLFTLMTVTDAEGCDVPLPQISGSYTVRENSREVVDAGSDVLGLGEVSYFVGDVLDLPVIINTGDADFPLTTPPSTSSSAIIWSNPISSDGSFDDATLLNPTYTIGVNDLFNNSIDLTITTTNNPLNCDAASDVLTINLVTAATATPEIAGGGNIFCWDGSPNPIITLAGTVGGGATTGIWERVPHIGDSEGGTYQGFDTGSSPATTTTNLGGTYRFTDFEQAQGSAELTLTPTDGLGGTAEAIIIQLINNPSPLFLNPTSSVCVGDQLVAYEVSFTAGSTYNWAIPTVGGTTFSGQGTNAIIVNWGSGPAIIGNQIIEVEETNTEGCIGIESETILVIDLPTIVFNPAKTNFTTADNIVVLSLEDGSSNLLVEGVDGNITFSGAAVYIDSNNDWVFNPQLLTFDDLIPANNIYTISYSFTNLLTCTSFGSTQFTLLDENNSINNLSRAYCSYDPKSLALDPILDDPSDVLDSIRISEDGNLYSELASFNAGLRIETGEYFFYPAVAALEIESPAISREFNVTYFFHNTSGSSNSKSQLTTVFARPYTDFDLLAISNICTTTAILDLNPLNPISNIAGTYYNFTITSPNPMAGPIVVEHDGNIGDNTTWSNFKFEIDKLIIQDPINGDTFDIAYTYARGNEFGFVCDSTVSKKLIVHEQPPKPTTNALANNTYCVVDANNIPLATITNHLSGPGPVSGGLGLLINADIRWTNEAGAEVSNNPFFKPSLAQLPNEINKFYISQKIPGLAGCQSEITEVIFINFSAIEFGIVENCLPSDSSPNAGMLTVIFPQAINPDITTINWAIEDKDGNILKEFPNSAHTVTTDLNIGVGFNPGSYVLKLRILTNTGCDATVSNNIPLLSTIEVSDTSPYFENFNTSHGSWVSINATNQTKWEWGIPQGDKINTTISDQGVWKTGLTNAYIANSNTFLYSSCFDISGLSRPMIDLKTFVDADKDDGAIIQFTSSKNLTTNPQWELLGTLNSGEAWYNAQSIAANPGNQNIGQYGWSGENQTAWVSSKHALDNVIDPNNVIFRIQFKSITKRDSETDSLLINDLDGFAIDDIFIGNRNRTVLLENFSSTMQATNTKAENEAIQLLVNNTTALAVIQYHPDMDGDDPLSNSPDADARALYYGITTTPRVTIDGKTEADLLYTDWGKDEYSTRALNSAPLTIITTVVQNGDAIDISSDITALENVPGNFIVHTAIVANQLLASNYPADQMLSGETNFNYVVQKMLPSASGKKFDTPLTQGDNITVTNTWSTSEQYAQGTYSIIIFVQDEQSRVIYQTEIIEPTINTVLGIDEELDLFGFASYPNPADAFVTFKIKQAALSSTKIDVYNQLGQLTHTAVLQKGSKQIELSTQKWTSGIYYIQTELNGAPIRKRIMVQH
ncbi:MAG: T9SS type A sorting domain-containing protein, partial [Cyclobacteriaceae bacterium]|nr:T9SS type A sorting domain-containing protein [Cyclobacteriaceae bacterium]